MSVANRVIKNTGFLYAKMGITIFISLYTTRLILNALGAEDYGIFNVVGGAIAMLGFLHVAMASATQRFMSYSEGEGNQNKQKSIFNISIILHVSIAIIVALALLIAGYFFFNGGLNIPTERINAAKSIYYFMIVSTAITIIGVPYEAVLNAHENMLYFSIVGVLESILKLIVAITVVYTLKDKLVVYGVLMAGVASLSTLLMGTYCHKMYSECSFHPLRYWNKHLMLSMTKFAGWNFLVVSSSMISQYGLSIVLNNFWGTILNAAQGIANQISGQLMAFSNTMMTALNPVIAKSAGSGQRNMMLTASMTGAKFSFLLLAFFAVPFIIEAPFILGFWLKEVPEWAILFTRLQLLRSLTEQLTVMISGTISAHGDIKKYSIAKSVLNILPIILTIILFMLGYPPYYLYITWISCWGILGGITILYFSNRNCGLSYKEYLSKVFLPALVSLSIMGLAGAIPLALMDQGFMRLITISAFTSAAFVTTYFALFVTNDEKNILTSIWSVIKVKLFGRKINIDSIT
ncbi:MATE family efflux transporter [Mangrovibacterium diazotrophicum]|uniref:Na+-driven multidrug efflux pump n=1 Tax=Mangrovibacterium diazotrophicum TaxID=1261403 RepID=A0A419W910_9BACT|nr:hypothetical protein [Mangrovibacterium diazotrophicum]RKD91967.1 Na+-driven multidrug efflux pump [Mangrovibacterium diazotrophicum]